MKTCHCEACQQKRQLFSQCISDMAGGALGQSRKTMMNRLRAMPENFMMDLRKLLTHLRRSPEVKRQISPFQHQLISAHRHPLRRFLIQQPHQLLATRRRVNNVSIPLIQAIGHLLGDNPKLLSALLNEIQAH